MAKSYPFYLATAFSADLFAGNPAAIVFIDDELAARTDDTLMKLGMNLSQPMTIALYPASEPSADPKVAKYRARFFTDSYKESGICGHATLAAAGLLFSTPGLVADGVEVLEFQTLTHGVLRAARKEAGWVEIQLPAAVVEEMPSEDAAIAKAAIDRAFGRDVKIAFMGRGLGNYATYLIAELPVGEDLKGSALDVDAFKQTGYHTNVITTASMTGEEAFISRMFAPKSLKSGEDHVCGSAHSLLIPYWERKGTLYKRDELVHATQVSARGGKLRVMFEQSGERVHIQGQVTPFAQGSLSL